VEVLKPVRTSLCVHVRCRTVQADTKPGAIVMPLGLGKTVICLPGYNMIQ